MSFSPSRCLVVGPSWVGDMVMAQSLFITLKQRYPGLLIDVLAPDWTRAITERMPEVNESVVMPLGHGALQLGVRKALGVSLRQKQYDWAIVLPNSFKAALVPYWAQASRRTGYTGELRYGLLNDRRRLDKKTLPRTVDRFVYLGLDAKIRHFDCPEPALSIDHEAYRGAAARFGLDPDLPVVAMAPGAEYGPAKRWPVEYFSQVAKQLAHDGQQIILLGSEKDQAITSVIAAQSDAIDLAGKTTLGEVVDLLGHSAVTLTNDSGLMHVAAASGTRVVALYGSSSPDFTPPLSTEARILRTGIECSPCFKRECPLGHYKCLRDLKPDQVIPVINEMLS
jgi:heptosyltransferase-2